MKVLVISAAYPPMCAGEADHTLHFCHHLASRGLDVHLLTTKMSIVVDGLPFKIFPVMRNWSWLELPRLLRHLKHSSPDAVILLHTGWLYNNNLMVTFLPTICKSLVPEVSFVTLFYYFQGGFEMPVFTRVVRKLVKQWVGPEGVNYFLGTLLRDSDRIMVLSEHDLTMYSALSSEVREKTVVVPPPPLICMSPDENGASRGQGRERLALKPDNFLIAYFGYAYRGKGVETLLQAFQMVSKYHNHVRLVMVGGGRRSSQFSHKRFEEMAAYEQAMRELSEELGIADKVFWTEGYASDSDEGSVYLRASDCCVLPFDDGVSLVRSSFAAAVAHGLPIITTRGRSLESAFVNGENVLLCPPKDPKFLAIAIESLVSSPELQERLGRGALDLAHQWFSWDKAVMRTLEAFKSDRIEDVQ